MKGGRLKGVEFRDDKSGMIRMGGGLDGKSGMIRMGGGGRLKGVKHSEQRAVSSEQGGNGLTLKVLRKHIKRLVNYAEAGDGVKIREELRRIVPEYKPKG